MGRHVFLNTCLKGFPIVGSGDELGHDVIVPDVKVQMEFTSWQSSGPTVRTNLNVFRI
jgi:hypothetical protein